MGIREGRVLSPLLCAMRHLYKKLNVLYSKMEELNMQFSYEIQEKIKVVIVIKNVKPIMIIIRRDRKTNLGKCQTDEICKKNV